MSHLRLVGAVVAEEPIVDRSRDPVIGEVYRTHTGALGRVLAVIEDSRCSPRHLSYPNDVVAALGPVGPGYNTLGAWSFDLTPAQPGDIGAHPHRLGCECGAAYDEIKGHPSGWYHLPASWSTP